MGAVVSCQICTLLICEKCAADWTTCSAPSGRLIRLGLTGRVRDVDPTGHRALVTQVLPPDRVLDLRTLRYVAELPSDVMRNRRRFAPRLLSTPHIVYAGFMVSDDVLYFDSLHKRALADGGSERLVVPKDDPPQRSSGVSATADVVSYVGLLEQVHVLDERGARTYTPLHRKVIHSICIDAERSLLASGSWSEIVLHELGDTTLNLAGRVVTEMPGNVTWLGLAGGVLASAVSDGNRGTYIEVRRIGEHSSTSSFIGSTFHSFSQAWGFQTGALSRDGRYLAVAFGARLDVLDLETGEDQTFDDHTDEINIVRFGADHVLVSADTDNRVIVRPRTPRGYDVPLVPVTLAPG